LRVLALLWKYERAVVLMTKDELEQLLAGEELMKTLDVKTLVLDIVREMNEDELLTIFWNKISSLEQEYVRGYLYMKRG
jgi:hypothetical protein